MTSITIDAALAAELAAVTTEIELRDETGKVLGKYAPRKEPTIDDVIAACPYPLEEMQQEMQEAIERFRRGESVGKPLSEIWRELREQDGESPK